MRQQKPRSIFYGLNELGQPYWDEIPADMQAIDISHGQPFTPRTFGMMTPKALDRFKATWSLTDDQVKSLLDDADIIAWNAIRTTGDGDGAEDDVIASAQIRQLKYALNALVELGDPHGWQSHHDELRGLAPALFSKTKKLKKCVIMAVEQLNALPPSKRGARSKTAASITYAADAFVESWTASTGRKPDKNKRPPSLSSFYAEIVPILKVQTAVRTYRRDGSQTDRFFDMSIPANTPGSPQHWLDAMPAAIKRFAVKASGQS